MNFKNINSKFQIFTLAVLIVGCGNIINSGRPLRAPSQSLRTGIGVPPRTYQCPDGFNVSPVQDPLTGDGYYQVCRKNGDRAQLSVWGVPAQTKTVCVYPAEKNNQGQLFLKVDLSTKPPSPVKECVTMQNYFNEVPSPGNYQNSLFRVTNFTHIFVIEATDTVLFERCMGFQSRWGKSIDFSICPSPSSSSSTGLVSWGDLTQLPNQ